MNSYAVTILYRTRCACLSWHTSVVAISIEQAQQIAERRLRRRSRNLTRIDSTEARLVSAAAA